MPIKSATIEVPDSPLDSVSGLKFSPKDNFLLAGSWDRTARIWKVDGNAIPKAMTQMDCPVGDVAWHDDGSKAFVAETGDLVGCSYANLWDLHSDAMIRVAAHEKTITTCHWINAPNYALLMTGSLDGTLKFWDCREPNPVHTIALPERCYVADVKFPFAVVGTAAQPNTNTRPKVTVLSLLNHPSVNDQHDSYLPHQTRCISILNDQTTKIPNGYAIGSIGGRVAVSPFDDTKPFSFACPHGVHASEKPGEPPSKDIYPVNDLDVNPISNMLATVSSAGIYELWDLAGKRNIFKSEHQGNNITKCAFSKDGKLFAFAVGYDWSKGHDYYSSKPSILIRQDVDKIKRL